MWDWNTYFEDFQTAEGNLKVTNWSGYIRAVHNIKDALRNPKTFVIDNVTRTWSKHHLLSMMEFLQAEPFVLEDIAQQNIGKDPLYALIRANILFPRPSPACTFDIPDCPMQPIIVAPSPLKLAAMRDVFLSQQK